MQIAIGILRTDPPDVAVSISPSTGAKVRDMSAVRALVQRRLEVEQTGGPLVVFAEALVVRGHVSSQR